ncbi:MAG: hypothetical protein WC911_01920 [Thermoleophilia bacterium]
MNPQTLLLALTMAYSFSADGSVSMNKAVTSSTIASAVPESLEMQAAIATWSDRTPGVNTLLKLIPRAVATKQEHKYVSLDSWGDVAHQTGMGTETGTPASLQFSSTTPVVWLQICNQATDVYFMAELQKMVGIEGTVDPVVVATNATLKREAWLTNRNMYLLDTSKSRAGVGAAGRVYKGVLQQVREGTDGTTGSSTFGSHEIDLRGADITSDNIRTQIAHILEYYGMANVLLMPPTPRGNLESSLEGANRITMGGVDIRTHLLGNSIAGLQSQGNVMWFATELALSAKNSKPRYTAPPAGWATTTVPTVVSAVVAGGTSGNASLWGASDDGNIYHVVTEVVNELEGAGTREPAGAAYNAVAVGQEVRLTLTPGSVDADRLRVYRGHDTDVSPGGTAGAVTEAWFLFEVAANGAVPVVTYDYNQSLPRTAWAVALDIQSPVADAMFNPRGNSLGANYADANDAAISQIGYRDNGMTSNVSFAQLGPAPMRLQLAPVALTAPMGRPVILRVGAPVVRIPQRCFTFKNVRDVVYN